jgi:hypothetical protein
MTWSPLVGFYEHTEPPTLRSEVWWPACVVMVSRGSCHGTGVFGVGAKVGTGLATPPNGRCGGWRMVGGVVDMGMYRGPGLGVVVENYFTMLVLCG